MIRLRQIALVAHDLNDAVASISSRLDLDVCYVDPGVAEFGLRNSLFCIGDQFLEVVSPTTDGTTAGRLLAKRGGDCGYMVLYEVDDLDRRMDLVTTHDVRVVWQGDLRPIRGRHLHPRDTGGTLVSLDQPSVPGEWHWGGPNWRTTRRSSVVNEIVDVTIASEDPVSLAARWTQLEINHAVNFVRTDNLAEGLTEVTLGCTDPARDGDVFSLCGVTFRLTYRD